MIEQATGAAGSAVDASFVKVIPFLLPTHGVFSDGKCVRINTFLLKGCILQAPLYVKYPAGTKETDMDTVVGEEPLFSKHFIRPIIFNAWTNRWVLLCTRFTGRAGACQGPAHNIDLGALRPHPISRALTWGSGPCSEAADSRQDGGGAGRSRRNSAPCPPGT